MNRGLSTVDLGRLLVDEQSFLGQTLKLGIEYGLLPANADEALRMYLQTQTMAFGRRNRTGIAIDRDAIEQGGYQATICLEIGLADLSEGDANRAAEILATGDFDRIRKRGWELAFFRLEAVRDEAELFPQRREAAFLLDYRETTRRWAHTEPETWLCSDPEEPEGPTIIDPISTHDAFEDLTVRLGLLKSLPTDALYLFGAAAGGGRPFPDLLRNLVVSLALGLDTLAPTESEAERFYENVAASPGWLDGVIAQVDAQVPEEADPGARDRLLSEVREAGRELVDEVEIGLGMLVTRQG